jgi:nucleotide-binding universal stress UspA family protein
MRVLCCLDGHNSAQLSSAAAMLLQPHELLTGLLYVIDSEPRREIERQSERFFRAAPSHRARIQAEEQLAAQEILDEGAYLFTGVERDNRLLRTGRPEREIVSCANEWQAHLILICRRTPGRGEPENGPKSVGHVARFVLDHAPCAVMLIRVL